MKKKVRKVKKKKGKRKMDFDNLPDIGPSMGWAILYQYRTRIYLEMTLVDEADGVNKKFAIYGRDKKSKLIRDIEMFYGNLAEKGGAWEREVMRHYREFRPRIIKLPSQLTLTRDFMVDDGIVWHNEGHSGGMYGVMLDNRRRTNNLYNNGLPVRPNIILKEKIEDDKGRTGITGINRRKI